MLSGIAALATALTQNVPTSDCEKRVHPTAGQISTLASYSSGPGFAPFPSEKAQVLVPPLMEDARESDPEHLLDAVTRAGRGARAPFPTKPTRTSPNETQGGSS